MKTIFSLSLMLLAVAGISRFAAAQAKPEEALSKDIAAIQGTWKVTAFEEGGDQVPAAITTELKHVFDGDHSLTMIVGKKQKPAAYKLDPTVSPKTIDVIKQNKTELGIYELDGDTLRICLAQDSQPRPTKFESKSATDRYGLVTFKRVADKNAEQPREVKPADKVKEPANKTADSDDADLTKPSAWGVRLCGWKEANGQ